MNTQPEALRLADAIADRRDWYEFDPPAWCPQAAALLRTQHADIERKDAMLRKALEALAMHGGAYLHHEPQYKAAVIAINSELAK